MGTRIPTSLVTEDEARSIALKLAEREGMVGKFEMSEAQLEQVATVNGAKQCWYIRFDNISALAKHFEPSFCVIEVDARSREAKLCRLL